MNHLFEACTGNLQSVREALRGGAERIELCAALPLGGLTPSLGMVRAVREMAPRLTVHLLVRPREGDFVYSEDEVHVMVHDIAEALPYVDGIVCGALLPDGDIDLAAMVRLVEASKDKPVTFHRAFDEMTEDPLEALEKVIGCGCHRILTSGCRPSAEEGIDTLRQLVQHAADRIVILAGAGVTPQNAARIARETGVTELHGSCKHTLSDGTIETDTDTVKALLKALS